MASIVTKHLYWIDDETGYYSILKAICPPDSNTFKLYPCAGRGGIKDFLKHLSKIKASISTNNEDSYFLIDINMPIPEILRNNNFWHTEIAKKGYQESDRQRICGLALANYIIEQIPILRSTSNIRFITSYSEHIYGSISHYNIQGQSVKDMICTKSSFNKAFLNNWLNLEDS